MEPERWRPTKVTERLRCPKYSDLKKLGTVVPFNLKSKICIKNVNRRSVAEKLRRLQAGVILVLREVLLPNEQVLEEVPREKLIVASRSPRRAEIFNAVGWPFEMMAANIDESRFESEAAIPYVRRLALTKAGTVAKNLASGLVLGADTVVLVDEEILGQPGDAEDARRMLRLLSGRWHEVLTAVALIRAEGGQGMVDHQKTLVRFAEMSLAEIDWYVETGEPMDKAGAYAVQGRAALFIEEIRGDYFNIVGLPIHLVYRLARTMR